MSYDRVLPAPVAVRHESSGSNFLHSNPFEHKIMNDLPMSHRALPHRPEPLAATCRYPEYRPNAVQQMAMYHGKGEPYTPPIDKHPIVDAYPRQHSISTASLPLREHSPPSSGSSSPIKSGKEEYASQWCLCKPDPKIPRPRNGESMMSAPMLNEHGKSLFLSFCNLVGIGPGFGMFSFIGFMLTRCFFVPFTAFILYRQHHQAAVVSHNPGLANPEISKIIGMQWRALTEGEKNKWRALAEVCRNNYFIPMTRYSRKPLLTIH